jgi:hypothetical protein
MATMCGERSKPFSINCLFQPGQGQRKKQMHHRHQNKPLVNCVVDVATRLAFSQQMEMARPIGQQPQCL